MTFDVMRAGRAARQWKPPELLEFEAVFRLTESIREHTPVNRSKSAETVINYCFTMGKSFQCEHPGSDRCILKDGRRRLDTPPRTTLAAAHPVSHPPLEGGATFRAANRCGR